MDGENPSPAMQAVVNILIFYGGAAALIAGAYFFLEWIL